MELTDARGQTMQPFQLSSLVNVQTPEVGRYRPTRGVWTFSTELTGRGQLAGLPDGSRWPFREKGGTTTGKPRSKASTPEGVPEPRRHDRSNHVTTARPFTWPAVLTANTWGRIGPRAFPQAP